MEPKVLYEDEDLLVIDKPSGMTVNRAETTKGEKTVQEWVEGYLRVPRVAQVSQVPRREYEIAVTPRDTRGTLDTRDTFYQRAGIVHRLDKETSGILLIAKNPKTFENLQRQFKERTVKKKYIALVHGEVKPGGGEINVPVGRLPWNRMRFGIVPGGRKSLTKYHVVGIFPVIPTKSRRMSGRVEGSHRVESVERDSSTSLGMTRFTLLEASPQTGRTHQIRVHLKYLGHPVVGDLLYAGRKQARADRKWCPRLFLHASEIRFRHPKTGEEMKFVPKLPVELQNVIDGLHPNESK